ncbi:Glycosyltransferase involved in cell wall bisynthesis [Zobellia uliginosa]|uniref:Glycosyltransferase involved in cell wall bisynthesis n=1 Tax=Zobellia uliginosa TaxID=143224 RepID=A0ABY1KKZ4_9FLAO|nr:glycosyltransferase family 4 protein [Zobellia uliginosa]SIS37098.1 Glycosyltransferase involved in cell wall bisynthesis [Zobellia uliginosa]
MKDKKRIAFFGIKYFPSRGGTSRVAENIILNLVDDYHITIYCYKNEQAKKHIKGVEVVQFPEIKFGNFGVFLYYFLCYLHIRFLGKYDIVHAHKIDSFFFLNGLSKSAKVIATAHEAPYKRDKWGKLAKFFFKVCERRFLNFKGVKTAISRPLCDFYKEQNNVDVLFIPNGINLTEGKQHSGDIEFWPVGLPQDTPYVLFAARRIMGTKGLHTMLEAYKKMDYKGHIFIAGELDNYPAYIERIKRLATGLKVHFLGFVSPLSPLLALVERSEYFVFPSETEGMSIMLLEVATTGKPILASDIPENTQVFSQEEVLFFENKNVGDLADKIKWIENNRASFDKLGLNAQKKVASSYTWDKIVLEYKRLYQNM